MLRRIPRLLVILITSIRALVVVLVLVPATLPRLARADTLTFPGPPPCKTTLQACIDGAAPGDVVEIKSNGPIDESPNFEKSLTLRAAAGFSPLLLDFNTILVVATGEDDVAITIEGITIERGHITAIHGTTGRFDLAIIDNEIEDGSFSGGIGVRTGSSGPTRGLLSFDIARNKVTMPSASSSFGDAISVGATNGSAYEGRIADNDIVMNLSTQNGAIRVYSVIGTGTVDIIGNKISGSGYNNGIHVRPGFGSVAARVVNNRVTGQTNVSGQPGAIAALSNPDGVSVMILNNTLVDNGTGLSTRGRADLGESMTGTIANNVIAQSSGLGMRISSDPAVTVVNRNNLLFDNGSNFFVPGPGTVFEDPLFLGPGDFRLAAGSPAIDAGNDTDCPATDQRGVNRPQLSACDIGAYEYLLPIVPWLMLLLDD